MTLHRYGQGDSVAFISNRLSSCLGPWSHELNDLHLPWGRAIAELCSFLVKELLRSCAVALASAAGDAGAETIRTVGQGRTLAAMGIDQLVQVLGQLGLMLSEKRRDRFTVIGRPIPLLSSYEAHLLRKISKASHRVRHNRAGGNDKNQRILCLLSCTRELCQSHLVAAAHALEANSTRPLGVRCRRD